MLAAGLLSACKAPPEPRYQPETATKEHGLAAIERAGCGGCHEIPGIEWPKGRLGPSLRGFDDVGLIAGAVPNTADNLSAFVRNAPAVKRGSTMPPIPLNEEEARAIAAYLYSLDDA
jgi:mono/diheme cytochrome c family protein